MSRVSGSDSDNLFMTLERARGESERQSGASQSARDLMEAMNPMNVLGQLAEVFKMLGSLSG